MSTITIAKMGVQGPPGPAGVGAEGPQGPEGPEGPAGPAAAVEVLTQAEFDALPEELPGVLYIVRG